MSERERNSVTRVRTHFLRWRNSARYVLLFGDRHHAKDRYILFQIHQLFFTLIKCLISLSFNNAKTLYTNIYHHHQVVPLAWISLTLSRHFSPSFIASGWSSGLHPVSSHGCWMYVRAGRPAFARPYVGVHRSTSLMSSSLLLQQCPACMVLLTWKVFVMGMQVAVQLVPFGGVSARTCSCDVMEYKVLLTTLHNFDLFVFNTEKLLN